MARRLQLHQVLKSIDGVQDAYFQPPPEHKLQYPCIVYERDGSDVMRADNLAYISHKRYQVTVIDRNPDSIIPDLVEQLPNCRYDRYQRVSGLHHHMFQLFF
jgi:hypothetical protein